jgi:hypothetical protein
LRHICQTGKNIACPGSSPTLSSAKQLRQDATRLPKPALAKRMLHPICARSGKTSL